MKMININNFIGFAHYINVQALQLVQKSIDLIENACGLQREARDQSIDVQGDWKTYDGCLQ